MSTNQAHAGGHHAHDENIDHQGNANLAVWLGLGALTFTTASFVASNVYLRGWSPTKFVLNNAELKDLPYYDTLMLIVSGLLLLIVGALFARNKWKAFNGLLGLTTLSFIVTLIIEFRLIIWFANYNKQIATIYTPTTVIQFLLTLVAVILLAVAGWYSSYGNKRKINQFFPVAMNVWLYVVLSGIVILLVENVMTVGKFAAWCGQHLS